ncbi:MAG: inorganic pyrophosphatase [Candidatus Cyclonatronum sp.]|uniref:inorganic pyrophosphatase n=1 Tax=Cyclonatronum sp. TaxID=3024185 RepID=UPI0025BBC06E|nr:inorganic pyrophosphatase [Cyclonatronum sp.]MCC5933116.1 inorganic pyrophosphatase [Balneolales bacterium]MCH8486675.1 inorganic pyrophosphatase [Cyclonatronum sp.]
MSIQSSEEMWKLLGLLLKSHPWHGVLIGDNAPEVVTTFIEIVPTDTIKYEVDKDTGFLKVDRPQRYSNVCPALYGFVPQTYCGDETALFCKEKSGIDVEGDGDPLDICILSEKQITHGNILLQAIPIGGFRMIDGNEADDKIIAVMKGDLVYGNYRSISDVPPIVVDRLRHYFLTYKQIPGDSEKTTCEITHTYDREEAFEVIRRSQKDYAEKFGNLKGLLTQMIPFTND